MGFSDESRAYRYYNHHTQRVLTSCNVIFAKDPTYIEGELPPTDPSPSQFEGEKEDQSSKPAAVQEQPKRSDAPMTSGAPKALQPSRIPMRSSTHIAALPPTNFRALNNPQARSKLPGWETVVPVQDEAHEADPDEITLVIDTGDDLQTLEEAMESPDWPSWKKAMEAEMGLHWRLKTWTLKKLPDWTYGLFIGVRLYVQIRVSFDVDSETFAYNYAEIRYCRFDHRSYIPNPILPPDFQFE
ncbi:hypothetical protein DENSPDRAFT_884312 [Dentipellis sp. KUC8613]|nr:hypothetical protein DENSPDRAFT_884312 [Dentipellis sp. KUC8613]